MKSSNPLEDYFADSEAVILDHPLVFKAALNIGDQAYKWLRTSGNLAKCLNAIVVALGTGGSTAIIQHLTASGFAKLLALIGLSSPATWPFILVGVVSASVYLGGSLIFKRSKDKIIAIVPKYINTPLDVMALELIALMLPLSLKIAYADGEIAPSERRAILDFFCQKWGYSAKFVDCLASQYGMRLQDFSYGQLAESFGGYLEKSKDANQKAIIRDFLGFLTDVVEADGEIRDDEREHLNQLETLLKEQAKPDWWKKTKKHTMKRLPRS